MINTEIKMIGFDYLAEETASEIYRNLKALFSTPEGTCAGDRSYGINTEYIDISVGQESNAMAVEVIEKISTYEPRVELSNITTEASGNGVKHVLHFVPAKNDEA